MTTKSEESPTLALSEILNQLKSINLQERASAVDTIFANSTMRGDWKAQNALAELMGREPGLFRQENAIRMLTTIAETGGSPEMLTKIRALLVAGLNDKDDAVRLASIRSLGKVGVKSDVLALEALSDPQAQQAIDQIIHRGPADALLDALVWNFNPEMDIAAYPPELRTKLQQFLRRAGEYRSPGALSPPPFPEWEMVQAVRAAYESRLAGISDAAEAPRLAADYVEDLRPCYEWEGYHGCPEREAKFADQYQASHSSGPFHEYLPLLAAHRWLCTAEAYEYENASAAADQSRRMYDERISDARASRVLLLRTAADRLAERGRCFAPRGLQP